MLFVNLDLVYRLDFVCQTGMYGDVRGRFVGEKYVNLFHVVNLSFVCLCGCLHIY